MEHKERTYRIGKPCAGDDGEWEYLPLEDDGTASTTASAIGRAAFLADEGRYTYEVWDTTTKLKLIVAWPGTKDATEYRRKCAVAPGVEIGRGFHGGHERVSDRAKKSLELDDAMMIRVHRWANAQAAKKRVGRYSDESSVALDQIAGELLAARATTATAAD